MKKPFGQQPVIIRHALFESELWLKLSLFLVHSHGGQWKVFADSMSSYEPTQNAASNTKKRSMYMYWLWWSHSPNGVQGMWALSKFCGNTLAVPWSSSLHQLKTYSSLTNRTNKLSSSSLLLGDKLDDSKLFDLSKGLIDNPLLGVDVYSIVLRDVSGLKTKL